MARALQPFLPQPTMNHATKSFRLLQLALVLVAGAAQAQQQPQPQPHNVLQLAATGSVEVQQDLLAMNLSTTREGADPALVQGQLKTALDTALAEARKAALPGQLDVRTGNFSLYPRHGRDGKIAAWNGTAELVLEGRDFARIAQTAGRIQTLTLAGVSFSLSREQRARVESEAQTLAIDRFKAKATELAKGFGFGSWSLREVSVNANDQGFAPRMRMVASAAPASAEMAVPVEAGKATVLVTVSGSVQLK
jgi:predicted secreted protein